MATEAQKKSYLNISRKGIERYKGSIRQKDEIVVVIGPIVKLMPPDDNKEDWVGKVGIYWVRSYRKSRGNWILGKFDRNIWSPVDATKLYNQVRKFAKTVYYVPYGSMRTNGRMVRKDYEKRPSTK